MPGYLLYFPVSQGNPDKSPEHFKAHGLDGLWHDGWAHWPVLQNGPDGGKGVVYTPRGRVGNFPAEQTWEDWGGYWFGRWRDKPVTPADLERHGAIGGTPTKLADGQDWLVPAAGQLPHAMHHDGQQWVRRIKNDYRDYWEQACGYYQLWREVWNSVSQGEDAELDFTWSQAADFATLALGFNYYLTPRIAGELGLFDDAALGRLQLAAIQGALILEVAAEKKTEPAATPATSSSASGAAA